MQIEKIAVTELSFDPSNARKHSEKNIEAIKGSLRKFGQRKPIVVRNGVVIAGNGTLQAALALGWSEIEVVKADDMTNTDAMAFALADNRTSELAEWDEEVLGSQLQALFEDGFEIGDFGFELPDVNIGELPGISDSDEPDCQQMSFILHKDQVEAITDKISNVKKSFNIDFDGNENSNGNALFYIVSAFNG
jgi:hypothetical protein